MGSRDDDQINAGSAPRFKTGRKRRTGARRRSLGAGSELDQQARSAEVERGFRRVGSGQDESCECARRGNVDIPLNRLTVRPGRRDPRRAVIRAWKPEKLAHLNGIRKAGRVRRTSLLSKEEPPIARSSSDWIRKTLAGSSRRCRRV